MQITVKGILSYPHLFTARSVNPGDAPKYSCTLLIPKNDPQVAAIQNAFDVEKANGFPSGFPVKGKIGFKDCAIESPDKPELAGYMELRCSTNADNRPHVVDSNVQPVTDPASVFPGVVAWVNVNTYSYSTDTSKGVSAGLNGVMITGETGVLGRLDNKASADQMFADVAGGAPVQPATPPGAPTAPPAPPVPPTPPVPPVAFPPAGWVVHPTAPGYFYCGQEVLSEAQLRAKAGVPTPSFA